MTDPESDVRKEVEKKNMGGMRSVDLPEDLIIEVEELMRRKHERRPIQAPLGLFITDLIRDSLNKAQISESSSPVLEIYAVETERVYIKDNRKNVVAELKWKDGSDLYCDIDGAKNCVHIGFAWAMPEVQKMLSGKKK